MAEARKGRARDEGAPVDEPVPNAYTIAREDPALEQVQTDIVEAGLVRSSLPADPEHEATDPGALVGHIPATPVPTVTTGDAPSGSSWTDQRDQAPVSNVNENAGPVPRLAYVVTMPRLAVHVRADAVQSRRLGEGDDAVEERFLTVRSAGGASREAVLEGEQVTLRQGDVFPEEAVEGQGTLLAQFGFAQPVSIAPAPAELAAQEDGG
jgi:hypothetical protein